MSEDMTVGGRAGGVQGHGGSTVGGPEEACMAAVQRPKLSHLGKAVKEEEGKARV